MARSHPVCQTCKMQRAFFCAFPVGGCNSTRQTCGHLKQHQMADIMVRLAVSPVPCAFGLQKSLSHDSCCHFGLPLNVSWTSLLQNLTRISDVDVWAAAKQASGQLEGAGDGRSGGRSPAAIQPQWQRLPGQPAGAPGPPLPCSASGQSGGQAETSCNPGIQTGSQNQVGISEKT